MRNIPLGPRIATSYIPPRILEQTKGKDRGVLLARVSRFNLDPYRLAQRTNLPVEKIEQLLRGEIAPINPRGTWAKTAVRVAKALGAEPEALFPKAIEIIGAAQVRPDEELFPPCLIGELYDLDSQNRE